MAVIKTILGNYFDISNPMEYDYPIEEIAWHLSQINRFCGATRFPYSVARHSVAVAWVCPKHLMMEGLMHDASEAYLGDVSSPLKSMLPGYKVIERRVMRAIRYHHGLLPEEPEQVKRRDRFCLNRENRNVMTPHKEARPGGFDEAPGAPPLVWVASTPKDDCDRFLEMYYELLRTADHEQVSDKHQTLRSLDELEEDEL